MSALDDLLAHIGSDPDRLHTAYAVEAEKREHDRDGALFVEVSRRLGWPFPDTPAAEVLAFVGRPGCPPLVRLVAVEESRPVRWQRPELLAALRARVAEVGPALAGAVGSAWPAPGPQSTGLFR